MKLKGIIPKLMQKASKDKQTIVLPESEDKRVLEAACFIAKKEVANIILLGKEEEILSLAKENKIDVPMNELTILNHLESDKFSEYAKELYELRKTKGVTLELAEKMLQDKVYFATMMVKQKDADGMVSGAIHSTSDTLRPALQIIKQNPKYNFVSSFFLMETSKKEFGDEGILIFSDCGLIIQPNKDEFKDIVIQSAKTYRQLTGKEEVNVAMLSFSTKGSAKSDRITLIQEVIEELNMYNLDFNVDGELQLDAALIPEVAKAKAPNSVVAGKANVLVFPDLEAGNIGYKLVQRFNDASAYGPITQGLNAPVNDLSRGSTVEDIIGTIVITCIQAIDN